MTKRITGYIFLVLSIILAIAIIGFFPRIFETLIRVAMLFNGKLESYQIGLTLGNFIYWVVHFSVTIALWNYGRRWTKKTVDKTEIN